MSEVKTEQVSAQHIAEEDFRHKGLGEAAGVFHVGKPAENGVQTFWYRCPCGCGAGGPLIVGNGFKPNTKRPSWKWNGSTEKPTLHPSVHHVGHWHGWLTDGVWRSV